MLFSVTEKYIVYYIIYFSKDLNQTRNTAVNFIKYDNDLDILPLSLVLYLSTKYTLNQPVIWTVFKVWMTQRCKKLTYFKNICQNILREVYCKLCLELEWRPKVCRETANHMQIWEGIFYFIVFKLCGTTTVVMVSSTHCLL